jgi:hypothetical protein
MIALRSNGVPTFVFHVEEMVSNRVAGAVTRAVRALDLGAKIRTDPTTQQLDVEPSTSDAQDVVEVLAVAGFTATLTASTADSAFAWVDSRYPAAGVSETFSLLPSAALGPLEP